MAGKLLKFSLRVVLDDDGNTIRLFTHDADAAELLWNQMLGSDYRALTAIDLILGSGIQLVPLDNAGPPPAASSM